MSESVNTNLSCNAVNIALHQLTKHGSIQRFKRGTYKPKESLICRALMDELTNLNKRIRRVTQKTEENKGLAIRGNRTLRGVLNRYPFLKEDPMYDPKRFPSAFEETLLMVCKRNHLNPERFNLEDPYVMDGCVKDLVGTLMYYYEAELSKVDDLIDSENNFKYSNIHIPIEKITYFMTYSPAFYVRGNIEKVLVLRGVAICEAYLKGKIDRDVLCSHGRVKKVQVPRDFIRVPVKTAVKKGRLKIGPLKDWLKMINQMPLLDLWLE